jgi:hypothetical protein
MSSDKIRVQLSNGAEILVENAVVAPEREVSGGLWEGRFSDVLPSVKALCNDFSRMLEDIAPDKATIEFGLSLQLETSGLWAAIGKAGGSSTFQITLEWNKTPPPVASATDLSNTSE